MIADPTPLLHDELDACDSEPYMTVVRARTGWVPLNLDALWRYRELLYFLA